MLLIRLPAVSKHCTDITHLFFMSPDAPINTNKITKEQSERPCSPVYLLLISSWSCTAVRRTGVRKPRRYIVNNGCVKLTLGRCCCWRTTLTQNHVSHHRITRRKKEKKKKKRRKQTTNILVERQSTRACTADGEHLQKVFVFYSPGFISF